MDKAILVEYFAKSIFAGLGLWIAWLGIMEIKDALVQKHRAKKGERW